MLISCSLFSPTKSNLSRCESASGHKCVNVCVCVGGVGSIKSLDTSVTLHPAWRNIYCMGEWGGGGWVGGCVWGSRVVTDGGLEQSWRTEQTVEAKELKSHFLSGLESGACSVLMFVISASLRCCCSAFPAGLAPAYSWTSLLRSDAQWPGLQLLTGCIPLSLARLCLALRFFPFGFRSVSTRPAFLFLFLPPSLSLSLSLSRSSSYCIFLHTISHFLTCILSSSLRPSTSLSLSLSLSLPHIFQLLPLRLWLPWRQLCAAETSKRRIHPGSLPCSTLNSSALLLFDFVEQLSP